MDPKPSPPAHDERAESPDVKPEPQNLKLDKHGYPLSPQPSDNKDDPLVHCPPRKASLHLPTS